MGRDDTYLYLEKLRRNLDLVSEKDIALVIKLSKKQDFEDKHMLPDILATKPSDETETALLGLLKDKDSLTRINAADNLFFGTLDETVVALFNHMQNDEDYLVSAYSVLSYFDVLENRFYDDIDDEFDEEGIYNTLLKPYSKETHPVVQTAYHTVFYKLGESQYFAVLYEDLEHFQGDEDSGIRHWVIGAFEDFVYETDEDWHSEETDKIIKDILTKNIAIEKNRGVKEKMKNLLKDIEERYAGCLEENNSN